MNILLLNQDWFAAELREFGHNVLSCGMTNNLDVQLESPLLHIDTVISRLPSGFVPDVVLWLDNSSPVMFTGLEESSIPILFYSVDTHHHAALHGYLYHICDAMLVAQKDYIPALEEVGCEVGWLPLWASRQISPSDDKRYQAVFVGTLNSALNPERVTFFDRLKEIAPVHVQSGDFGTIFPASEIVINQTVKGDLNFRVFEAMISGAMLLTEASGNGLLELFEPGRHLMTYEKNNVEDAAAVIKECLADPTRMRAIGAAGRDEILAKHLPVHRAAVVEQSLKSLQKKSSRQKFFAAMLNYSILAVSFEKIDVRLACCALVAAMKVITIALKHGEQINSELAAHAVLACMKYDILMHSRSGDLLLQELQEAYPDEEVLTLYRIRHYLNSGERSEAAKLALRVSHVKEEEVFLLAEHVLTNLLFEFDSSGRFKINLNRT